MSEWQPIKTLPRDGRYVIVYRPLAMETGDETFTITKTLSKGSTATVSPQGVKHWTARWCHPTHWMPLPEPPKIDTVCQSKPYPNGTNQ
jgi:hypothetical protein